MADQEAARGSDASGRPLWFTPPDGAENRRRALTRERVLAEALEVISESGVETLSMRALATRLGVVPGALYRHVRSKEQLYDLILDGVLAEVDCRADPSLTWAEQITELAQRLRAVLENHPGIAGLLKARDPLSPHSLALTEAFLTPLHAAGMPGAQAALAFRLIYDYTLGFALSDRTTASEQRAASSEQRAASSESRTPRPGVTCTRSSGHCLPTASQCWLPSASTSGLMTAISGSRPACTRSSRAFGRPCPTTGPAAANPADHPRPLRHPGLASSAGAGGVGLRCRPMVSCWVKSPPGCCGREAARWCVSS